MNTEHLSSLLQQAPESSAEKRRRPAGKEIGWAEVEFGDSDKVVGYVIETTIGEVGFLYVEAIIGGGAFKPVYVKATDISRINPIDEIQARFMAPKEKLLIETIQRVVARHFGMSVEQLLSRRRTDDVARPRMIAMALARLAGYSTTKIGKAFNRDHGTVIHASRAVDAWVQTDVKFRNAVHSLWQQLGIIQPKA